MTWWYVIPLTLHWVAVLGALVFFGAVVTDTEEEFEPATFGGARRLEEQNPESLESM